jgi:hypothetical protein
VGGCRERRQSQQDCGRDANSDSLHDSPLCRWLFPVSGSGHPASRVRRCDLDQ